ncbi:MAG TPA: hypothetical protein VLY21_00150 [Nitrososphaerales archaeon]|nr:hypothetical protein [Nitrososphaerales archaeon]
MSLTLPALQPPRIGNPATFFLEFGVGLLFVLACTLFADILGTAMFKRGFAKPFYILGRRIHHNCIYVIVPVSYGIVGVLFLLGVVQIEWAAFWDKLAIAGLLATAAIATDVLGDRYWPRIRINAVLHHEWIYTLVPAYVFTYMVHVAI